MLTKRQVQKMHVFKMFICLSPLFMLYFEFQSTKAEDQEFI